MARRTFDAETLDALLDIALPGTVQMAMGMLADVWGLTDVTPTQEVNWRKYTAQMVDAGAVYSVVNVVWHRSGEVEGTCSCGGVLCAHQVAVILTLSESHGLRLEGAASVRRPAPGWKDILDQYLPQHSTLGADVARPEDIIEPTPVCLFFRCEDDEVSIRPGERGKTGSWIKGKAGWGNVFEMDLDMRVLEVFDEFADLNYTQSLPQNSFGGLDFTYGIGGYRPTRRHEWLSLHALPAGGLWEKLRTLRDAGVEMISWEGRGQVALPDEAAQVRMSVTGDSDLALRAELLYGGRATEDDPMTTHVFLGDPMDVIAETRVARGSDKRRGATGAVRAADVAQVVALRQLPEPPSPEAVSLLTDVDTLHVAASDRAEFERDFLPRIRGLMSVESPDGSYIQPEPLPPVLVLEVNPLVDKDGMLVRVRLGWRWDRSSGILDSEHERAVAASVRDLGVEPVEQTLAREQAVPFLAETLGLLDALDYVRTQVTADVPQFRAAQDAPSVRIGTGGTGQDGTDWLDLFVTVTIGGEEVNFVDLFTALNRDEEIFVLPSGTYFRLDTPELEQLHRIICEARTLNDVTVDGLRISRYQVDMWAELVESGIVDAQANEWWSRVEALARGGGEDGTVALDGRDIDVPADLQATLRDYQCYGFRWLETLRRNNLGGILADDMGLGKTLQVIAMMLAAQQDAPAPFLVVAPTSVVGNWVREVEKFAPSLTVVGIDRTEKKLGCTVVDEIGGAQVVVTSYTLFRLDAESYNSLEWAGAVFDEAQMIKNHTSRAYACARKLDAPLKIAVTGTPMENNLLELWALSSLVCPGLLGSKRHFEEFFRFPVEKGQDAERLALLQRRLRPFLMRRTKEKVADDLPAKTENVLELDLYPKHRQIYERRLQRERQKLLGLVDDMNANRFEVFRTLTLLRQLALDSELAGEASSPSAKLDTLADLLANATQEGHRVLVLSQFTRFLSKARDAATAAGIDSLYLDGKSRGRQKLIDSFSDGDGAPVFFISLKAGGFGLNLTEADYVVLLDPWWNPATEAQAVDRAHRIGQTRSVMVYRLVSADTIESKVMDLKTSKAALFDRVLDGGGTVETDGLSVEDIRSLVE